MRVSRRHPDLLYDGALRRLFPEPGVSTRAAGRLPP